MSPLDLDGLQSIIDSASPAPWQVSLSASDAVIAPNREHSMDADELRYYGGPVVGESIQGPDQVFIVIAREALPALIAELRAAREDFEELRRLAFAYGDHEYPEDCPQPENPDICFLCHVMALDKKRQARDGVVPR